MSFRTPTFPWPTVPTYYSDATKLVQLTAIHRQCGGMMIDPSWTGAQIDAAIAVAVATGCRVAPRCSPWDTSGAYSWITTHDAEYTAQDQEHLDFNQGGLEALKVKTDAAGLTIDCIVGDCETFGNEHSTGAAWLAARRLKYQRWQTMAKLAVGDVDFEWYGRMWLRPFASAGDEFQSYGVSTWFSDDDPGDSANCVLYRPGQEDRLSLNTLLQTRSLKLELDRRELAHNHRSVYLWLGQYYTTNGALLGLWGLSAADAEKKAAYWGKLLNTPGYVRRMFFYPGILLGDPPGGEVYPWPNADWLTMFQWFAKGASSVDGVVNKAMPLGTNPIVVQKRPGLSRATTN